MAFLVDSKWHFVASFCIPEMQYSSQYPVRISGGHIEHFGLDFPFKRVPPHQHPENIRMIVVIFAAVEVGISREVRIDFGEN